MVASRDILKDENKLLTNLEKLAASDPSGGDWVAFFSDWRSANLGDRMKDV